MTNELMKLDNIMALGQTLSESKYFTDAKEASQAVVKVLAGQELGIGPVAAMTGIYIVKGKVVLSGAVMASLIKSSKKYDYRIKDHSNGGCLIEFFENDQSVGASEFTIEDAKMASLTGGDNWKKYPKNMCFNRALSNGAKWFCPDLFSGQSVYTEEEIEPEPEPGLVLENGPELLISSEATTAELAKPIDQAAQTTMIQTILKANPELAGKPPVEITQFINAKIEESEAGQYNPVTVREVIDALE